MRSSGMVGVLYTEGCIILSLTVGPLSLNHSNEKMPTFLHTCKRVTELTVWQQSWHLPSLCSRQCAGKKYAIPSSRARCWSCLAWISMRIPSRTQHNWHDIRCPETAWKMSWTASRLMHGHRWSNKGIWWSTSRPSLEYSEQIWLPSHLHCHTTTIPHRHVCSNCHSWFSVLQLSCWSGGETFCAPILQPASSRYCSSISLWPPIICLRWNWESSWWWSSSRYCSSISLWPPIICLRWNWESSWWWSLQPATSPNQKYDFFCRYFCPKYADDAAFPSPTADGRRRSLDNMSETYNCAGLIANTAKT